LIMLLRAQIAIAAARSAPDIHLFSRFELFLAECN
jgi:hypothetical protein